MTRPQVWDLIRLLLIAHMTFMFDMFAGVPLRWAVGIWLKSATQSGQGE